MRTGLIPEAVMPEVEPKNRPFLKWAGGKTSLFPFLDFPRDLSTRCYVEPFLGGGAVFFALSPRRAVLSDLNRRLIIIYRCVRDDAVGVLAVLRNRKIEYDKGSDQFRQALYYEVRKRLNEGSVAPPARFAADFIFLNRTCFNGLYRENKKSLFNTPWGKYKTLALPGEASMLGCAAALRQRGVSLEERDFGKTIDWACSVAEPMFLYLDPPYVGTFSAYQGAFTDQDHKRLVQKCHQLTEAGIPFLLSNSEAAAPLYKAFDTQTVEVPCSVSAGAAGRRKRVELLVRNSEVWP